MKVKKSKLIIGLIILILFISIANSCSNKNKNTESTASSENIESTDSDTTNEDDSTIDSEDTNDDDTSAKDKDQTDSNVTDSHPVKSINDYPDFWNLVDKSHPAAKIITNGSKFDSPKSICENKDYYIILINNSLHAYSKDTGEYKVTSSLNFVNKDYKEKSKKDKKNKKEDTEKTRDYNEDKIDAICASENNLWVCHSSKKTSTITKFNLSSVTSAGRLSSEHSFNLKYKCNFLAYDNGILWTGEDKSHGACSIYGYSVDDDRNKFWKSDPKYKYSISIPNYIDSIAIKGNKLFLHENKYSTVDSHIYVFDNVNPETSKLNDIATASKTITIPRRPACITYSQDRLVTLFSNYGIKDDNNIIKNICPLIIQ